MWNMRINIHHTHGAHLSTLTIHMGHTCINTDYSCGTHASAFTTQYTCQHSLQMQGTLVSTLIIHVGHMHINTHHTPRALISTPTIHKGHMSMNTHRSHGTLLHQHMPHLCDKQHSPHTQGMLTRSTLLTQKYQTKRTKCAIQNDNRAGERKKEKEEKKKPHSRVRLDERVKSEDWGDGGDAGAARQGQRWWWRRRQPLQAMWPFRTAPVTGGLI